MSAREGRRPQPGQEGTTVAVPLSGSGVPRRAKYRNRNTACGEPVVQRLGRQWASAARPAFPGATALPFGAAGTVAGPIRVGAPRGTRHRLPTVRRPTDSAGQSARDAYRRSARRRLPRW
jgi:hypothetical protein